MADIALILLLTLCSGLSLWKRGTKREWAAFYLVYLLLVAPLVSLSVGSTMRSIDQPVHASTTQINPKDDLRLAASLVREGRITHRDVPQATIERQVLHYRVVISHLFNRSVAGTRTSDVLVLPLDKGAGPMLK